MVFSAPVVSNNILRRSFDEGVEVSSMKLQRLLYFVASDYAKSFKGSLLGEQFQAWDYGPVVRSVYEQFRCFGGSPIRKYAKDAQGEAYLVDELANTDVKSSLDRVWDAGKSMSAVSLSRVTHLEGSAWFKTFCVSPHGFIDDFDVMNDVTYFEPLGLR